MNDEYPCQVPYHVVKNCQIFKKDLEGSYFFWSLGMYVNVICVTVCGYDTYMVMIENMSIEATLFVVREATLWKRWAL